MHEGKPLYPPTGRCSLPLLPAVIACFCLFPLILSRFLHVYIHIFFLLSLHYFLIHLLIEISAARHLDVVDFLIYRVVLQQILMCIEAADHSIIQNYDPVSILHT